MVFAQPHFIAHLTLTTFSHETVAIYNSYAIQPYNLWINTQNEKNRMLLNTKSYIKYFESSKNSYWYKKLYRKELT